MKEIICRTRNEKIASVLLSRKSDDEDDVAQGNLNLKRCGWFSEALRADPRRGASWVLLGHALGCSGSSRGLGKGLVVEDEQVV